MQLSRYINTFGHYLQAKYGCRVHKLAINAGLTCPNRDGSKGHGGCTFCNNDSFSPNSRQPAPIAAQIAAGRAVIRRRTGADRYLAYFQAYTNTYGDIDVLRDCYQQALVHHDVIGLSIGTRPDCVPDTVLDLLQGLQDDGNEIWLELGLQSAFDATLRRVNRGHGFAAYANAVRRARQRGLPVCCHLIVGLPGEQPQHSMISLQRVLDHGVDALKIHPLHVVKNTVLAGEYRCGEYTPISQRDYVDTVCSMIAMAPREMIYHRLTGTAQNDLLLAPLWCRHKWQVLNDIARTLQQHGSEGASHHGVDAEASHCARH